MASADTNDEDRLGALLAAAQRGDADAYRAFLKAILPLARAIARRRAPTADAAEDIVQDALLTIHRVRHTYMPGRPVRPWLAAIVSRRAIDAARRGGRIGARELHDVAAYETFADDAANRSEQAAQSAQEVGRMLDALTPRQRQAVELVKLKEMSLAEASDASGQSIGALKVNVHRAIQRMRQALARGGGEGP